LSRNFLSLRIVPNPLAKSAARAMDGALMALQSSSLLSIVVATCVRLLAWTWRLRVTDEAGVLVTGTGALPPVVWVFWHNRLLVIPVLYERFCRWRPGAVLISRSRDGGILAGCIERFGGNPVRGSSSRGGAAAMRILQQMVGDGYDAYITPDGPKGPRYSMSAGAVWLAQNSGAPVMPVSVEVSSCWRLGRWDGFLIPKPFARVEITLRQTHTVPPVLDEAGLLAEQERLRELMMSQTGLH
jgi:lysophospholipid acyltransferase (LPLAT)-like uncharacterized protein